MDGVIYVAFIITGRCFVWNVKVEMTYLRCQGGVVYLECHSGKLPVLVIKVGVVLYELSR